MFGNKYFFPADHPETWNLEPAFPEHGPTRDDDCMGKNGCFETEWSQTRKSSPDSSDLRADRQITGDKQAFFDRGGYLFWPFTY